MNKWMNEIGGLQQVNGTHSTESTIFYWLWAPKFLRISRMLFHFHLLQILVSHLPCHYNTLKVNRILALPLKEEEEAFSTIPLKSNNLMASAGDQNVLLRLFLWWGSNFSENCLKWGVSANCIVLFCNKIRLFFLIFSFNGFLWNVKKKVSMFLYFWGSGIKKHFLSCIFKCQYIKAETNVVINLGKFFSLSHFFSKVFRKASIVISYCGSTSRHWTRLGTRNGYLTWLRSKTQQDESDELIHLLEMKKSWAYNTDRSTVWM